ncbi:hypothetical protein ABZ924_02165 [Streptomyces sp. NPDC046876]|uniref:hypothetical protein n=1 Tax=Streptomyces sp. NPDC046876 TaxID=3155616 RepID=UPI0033D6492A
MTGSHEAQEAQEQGLEPLWMVVANVVQWRRYGEGGQGQRPGTKSFKGGSRVYVQESVDGAENCMVIGRPRHTRRYVAAFVSTRHLHTFRPKLVRSPAVLRTAEWSGFPDGAAAARAAAVYERKARELRTWRWADWHHPEPCLCHECLTSAAA